MKDGTKNLKQSERERLLGNNFIGHLAFVDKGVPYTIPITYYFDHENNRIISYSSEGHKVKAMRKNPQVALCVNEIDSMSEWRSVLVHGEFEEVKGSDTRFVLHLFSEGVKRVIEEKEHKHLQFINEFSSKLSSGGVPIVYQIKITDSTSKYRAE